MKPHQQKQEHTNSYYAVSVNEVTDYPQLEGACSADICVIGGGFTGVSAALTLAERGFSVALVEGNRIGWGASGRNGGQVINGISGLAKITKRHGEGVAGMVWDLRWRGNDIIRERVEKYAIRCDLKDGYIEVATKPRHLAHHEEYARQREQHGFPYQYELWDRHKTTEMLGTEAYQGGFICYRDGHLHPLNLCIGEARAAKELGAHVFEQSPVTRIRHGKRPRVVTENGHIDADAVILAGNAYSQLEPEHLANLVFGAGSYIIGTEPLGEDVVNEINPLDIAVCDSNEVVDYYRLSADKRLLYGGACNYSGREPADIRRRHHAALRPLCEHATFPNSWH
jgi:glycine/D-amino acid oxidase-like deaminating enzyme